MDNEKWTMKNSFPIKNKVRLNIKKMIVRFPILLLVLLFSNSNCSNKSQSTESQSNTEIPKIIKLPSGKTTTDGIPHFTIKIENNGHAFFKEAEKGSEFFEINLDNLTQILHKAHKNDTSIKSVIFVGKKSSSYSDFVKVMNVAKRLEMKVSLNINE